MRRGFSSGDRDLIFWTVGLTGAAPRREISEACTAGRRSAGYIPMPQRWRHYGSWIVRFDGRIADSSALLLSGFRGNTTVLRVSFAALAGLKPCSSTRSSGVRSAMVLPPQVAAFMSPMTGKRAKQETGFGAFEVRTYTGLIRHWLCSRMAMFFLAEQTERLRGEKSADHSGAGGRGGQRSGLGDLDIRLAWAG